MTAPTYGNHAFTAVGGVINLSVTKPASLVAGQMVVVLTEVNAAGTYTWGAPDGSWTSRATTVSGALWTHVVTADDVTTQATPWAFTRNGLIATNRAVAITINGVSSIGPVEFSARSSKTSFTYSSKTISVADSMLLSFAIDHSGTGTGTPWSTPGTVTEAYDSTSGIIGHETVQPSSTGTRLFTPAASTNFGPAQIVLEPPPTLVAADTANASTSDTSTITQTHVVAPADTANAHTTDASAVTQLHLIAPADSEHAHASDATTIHVFADVAPADSEHAHASESPALTQVHEIAPADCAYAHTSESPLMVSTHLFSPHASVHAHASESPVVTQVHLLVPLESVHAHESESPVLTVIYSVAPADTANAHTSSSPLVLGDEPTPPSRTSVAVTTPRISTATGTPRISRN